MKNIEFSYKRRKLFPGFDGKLCKVQPSIAFDGDGTVLINYTMLDIGGCDVFYGNFICQSTDGGKTFSNPKPQKVLEDIYPEGVRTAYVSTVFYNKTHKKWFGLGRSTLYADSKAPILRGGHALGDPIFLELDAKKGEFTAKRMLPFPFEYTVATPMGQIIEMENGDILVPFYFSTDENPKSRCMTVRYAFTNNRLEIVTYGKPIENNLLARGLGEPSIAKLGDKYYMTIRCDETGYFAVSDDGLNFGELHEWCFDDRKPIGNYNTQQHWVTHKDGLFLAYTRKGAHNDHVFRHRAPLFMARFDEQKGCLIKATEVILVPELGARLGNFNVISADEKTDWLITAEWMQYRGCEKYGSDNSLWWAEINFD